MLIPFIYIRLQAVNRESVVGLGEEELSVHSEGEGEAVIRGAVGAGGLEAAAAS